MVSPDALALVRFGLRAADDPRIVNTVKVIDALLKVDTPSGPSWHRYNGDGYGEHDDGSPFDGTGTGRAWPLLTGERGHYELAAGRPARAEELAAAMEAFAGDGLLIPEQIWDAPDIVERELFAGQASGSAQPLVWAHAEYLKLRRSIRDGRVFDQPPQTVARYVSRREADDAVRPLAIQPEDPDDGGRQDSPRRDARRARPSSGASTAGSTCTRLETVDVGLGVYVADLATTALPSGASVEFTFFWRGRGTLGTDRFSGGRDLNMSSRHRRRALSTFDSAARDDAGVSDRR